MGIFKVKQWGSILEMLQSLNEKANYVVVRNYETLETNVLLDEHDDIDLLCDDVNVVVDILQLEKRCDDDIHYWANVGGKRIRVDLRHVGDGYYDDKWERCMLEKSVKHNGLFYVMDSENYYYSLLYHEFVHKEELREEYIVRLKSLAYQLQIEFDKSQLWEMMLEYMNRNQYRNTGYRSKK